MDNRIVVLLRREAKNIGYHTYNTVVGEITLDQKILHQSSGAVYGVWAKAPSADLFPPNVIEIPSNRNWFPVYWGKDISPCSRIAAHVRDPKGTGNAKLHQIDILYGMKLIFGAIWVSHYDHFEKHLQKKFPPLIRSTHPGGKSRFIKIMN